jgi:hypothetical protein
VSFQLEQLATATGGWRLLQAATDLLHSDAPKQPLLVVLEDPHDADPGTLDLLLYLARNLHGTRICTRVRPGAADLTQVSARVVSHG